MKNIIFLINLLIIFSCSETPVDPPIDHNSSLEGYIIFEGSSPESLSTDITLFREGEVDAINQTQSDPTGFYYFDDLTSGNFQINFSTSGYEIHTLSATLASNEAIIIDTIELKYIPIINYIRRTNPSALYSTD